MCFLKSSDFSLLTIYFRFSVRLMVAGSIAAYTISFLAIWVQRFDPTPQILHDRDPTVNPRQSRHNTSIASRHSVWQFLTLYLFVVILLLLLGSAKGTSILVLRSETKLSGHLFCCHFCCKFSCLYFWARRGMSSFLKSPENGLFAGAISFAL